MLFFLVQSGPPNPPSYFASVRGSGFRSRAESDRSVVIMFNSSQTDLPPILRTENEGTARSIVSRLSMLRVFGLEIWKELVKRGVYRHNSEYAGIHRNGLGWVKLIWGRWEEDKLGLICRDQASILKVNNSKNKKGVMFYDFGLPILTRISVVKIINNPDLENLFKQLKGKQLCNHYHCWYHWMRDGAPRFEISTLMLMRTKGQRSCGSPEFVLDERNVATSQWLTHANSLRWGCGRGFEACMVLDKGNIGEEGNRKLSRNVPFSQKKWESLVFAFCYAQNRAIFLLFCSELCRGEVMAAYTKPQ